jgi:MFS family permease
MSILQIFYLPYEREFKSEKRNSLKTCSFGSLIGTTIGFFFYIYANAAVLVFPQLFSFFRWYQFVFVILSYFSIAFLSRPLGSAVFGHYGDKVGRKTTLVIIDHGISTVSIGFTGLCEHRNCSSSIINAVPALVRVLV